MSKELFEVISTKILEQQKLNPEKYEIEISPFIFSKLEDFVRVQPLILESAGIPIKEWFSYRNQWTKDYAQYLKKFEEKYPTLIPSFKISVPNLKRQPVLGSLIPETDKFEVVSKTRTVVSVTPTIPQPEPKITLSYPIDDKEKPFPEYKIDFNQLEINLDKAGLSPTFIEPIATVLAIHPSFTLSFLLKPQSSIPLEVLRRTALSQIGSTVAKYIPVKDVKIARAIERLGGYAGLYDTPLTILSLELIQQLKNLAIAGTFKEKYDPLKFETFSEALLRQRKVSPFVATLLGIGETTTDFLIASSFVNLVKQGMWKKVVEKFVEEAKQKGWTDEQIKGLQLFLTELEETFRGKISDWQYFSALLTARKVAKARLPVRTTIKPPEPTRAIVPVLPTEKQLEVKPPSIRTISQIGWEKGLERPFSFDPNSTKEIGIFRLQPPEVIDPLSYKQIPSETKGVSYVVGKSIETGKTVVQAIHFDKSIMPEEKAKEWWEQNKNKFKFYQPPEQIPKAETFSVKEATKNLLKKDDILKRKVVIKNLYPQLPLSDAHLTYVAKMNKLNSSIVLDWTTKLGVKILISSKKMPATTLGRIFVRTKEIQLRRGFTTPVLLHELGHYVMMVLTTPEDAGRSLFDKYPDEAMKVHSALQNYSMVEKPKKRELKKEIMPDLFIGYVLDSELTRNLAPNLTREFEDLLKQKGLDNVITPNLFEQITQEEFSLQVEKDFEKSIKELCDKIGYNFNKFKKPLQEFTRRALYIQNVALFDKDVARYYFEINSIMHRCEGILSKADEILENKLNLIKEYRTNTELKNLTDELIKGSVETNRWFTSFDEFTEIYKEYKNLDKIKPEMVNKAWDLYKTIETLYRTADKYVVEALSYILKKPPEEIAVSLKDFYIHDSQGDTYFVYGESSVVEGKIKDVYYAGFDKIEDAIKTVVTLRKLGYENVHIDVADEDMKGWYYFVIEENKIKNLKFFKTKEEVERHTVEKGLTNYQTIEVRLKSIENVLTSLRERRLTIIPTQLFLEMLSSRGIPLSDELINKIIRQAQSIKWIAKKRYVPGVPYDFMSVLERTLNYLASVSRVLYKKRIRQLLTEQLEKEFIEGKISKSTRDYLSEYLNAIDLPYTFENHIIRSLLAIRFLSIKPAFIVAEFLQKFLASYPLAQIYVGLPKASRFFVKSIEDYFAWITGTLKNTNPELQELLDRASKEGYIEQFTEGITLIRRVLDRYKGQKLTGAKLYRLIETINLGYIRILEHYLRASDTIVGYYIFKDLKKKGKKTIIAGVEIEDPYKFATIFADWVNVDYSRSNISILERYISSLPGGKILSDNLYVFMRFVLQMNLLYIRTLTSSKEFYGLDSNTQLTLRKILFYLMLALFSGGIFSLPFSFSIYRKSQEKYLRNVYKKLLRKEITTEKVPITIEEYLRDKYPSLFNVVVQFFYGIPTTITGFDLRRYLSPDIDRIMEPRLAFFSEIKATYNKIKTLWNRGERIGALLYLLPSTPATIYHRLKAVFKGTETGYITTVLGDPTFIKKEDIGVIPKLIYVFTGIPFKKLSDYYVIMNTYRDFIRERIKDLSKTYDKIAYQILEIAEIEKTINKIGYAPQKYKNAFEKIISLQQRKNAIWNDIQRQINFIVLEWGVFNMSAIDQRIRFKEDPYAKIRNEFYKYLIASYGTERVITDAEKYNEYINRMAESLEKDPTIDEYHY